MAIGDPVDNRSAQTGNGPDHAAHARAAQRQPDIAVPVAEARAPALAQRRLVGNRGIAAEQIRNLGNGEQAKADDDQRNAVIEIVQPEGHAELARCGCPADRADQQTHRTGRQPLGQAATGQNRHHRQAEQGQHEQFGRAEHQDQRPCHHDEAGQHDCAENPAEHRGNERRRQCPCGLPLPGERKAVQHRRLTGRRPRNPHQHRRERVRSRDHRDKADQHGKRRDFIHSVKKRHQQRQTRNPAKAGDHPDHQPDGNAKKHVKQMVEGQQRMQRGK